MDGTYLALGVVGVAVLASYRRGSAAAVLTLHQWERCVE